MKFYPELPYTFYVVTPAGLATITFPATQWDVAAGAQATGPGADMAKDYIAAYGIGFAGQLFTLDGVSPMDLDRALAMNQTAHHSPAVLSYEVIGYVPDENPDTEDDSRWADDEEGTEGEDD